MARTRQGNVIAGLLFFLLVVAALALFFIPAVIIRPFAYQSPRALLVAVAVRQASPLWTLLAVAAALLLAAVLWTRVSLWKKILLVLGVVLAAGSATMARLDYFEWMFHPIGAAGFEAASQTKLDPAEMVLSVSFGGDSRAYPIRAMAYHHILNDTVGGIPVAVTY